MTVCKNCDGSGTDMFESECRFCNGTGVVEPMTNEEWFCSLSTEEKAKWFTAKAGWIMRMNQSNNPKKLWFEWLKEEHKK